MRHQAEEDKMRHWLEAGLDAGLTVVVPGLAQPAFGNRCVGNRQTTKSNLPGRRLLQQGTTSVAVMTLLAGLALAEMAEAAEPIQVVAVSGQTVCADFSEPPLVGPDTKISGNGTFMVSVLDSEVEVTVHSSQLQADFVVLEGPGVDAFVAKGAKDAQLYTFADAADAQGMTTAASQKIQTVTVCSDGEDTVLPNLPLPACNVFDNRDDFEDNDCTATDNEQGTIAFKVATRDAGGAEKGQTFSCICGDTVLVDVEGTVPGNLDEFEAFAITSQNPTCLVWSKVGGTKRCVLSE